MNMEKEMICSTFYSTYKNIQYVKGVGLIGRY